MAMSKLFQKLQTFTCLMSPFKSLGYFDGDEYVQKSEIIQPDFERMGQIKRSGYGECSKMLPLWATLTNHLSRSL